MDAQQARRVLDRLVGFKLSPVLWRKVKPSLSAGRVQSVAVRLIVEREREIQNFKCEVFYSINGIFASTNPDGSATEVKALLGTRFKTHEEVEAFLNKCKDATFTVDTISKKPLKRTPAPPFTTSTLQQEASKVLNFATQKTMRIAQQLYEGVDVSGEGTLGLITYMRTDSLRISDEAMAAAAGLEFNYATALNTNTLDAHRLTKYAQREEPEKAAGLIEALYENYFVRNTELADHDVLKAAAAEAGLNMERVEQVLASDEYLHKVRGEIQEAAEMGIHGVPFFIIGQYGVSGAQPAEFMQEVLETVLKEEMQQKREEWRKQMGYPGY